MASDVLALIPARAGSRGIPMKNFRALGDRSPVHRAAICAHEAGIADIWISTDHPTFQGIVAADWDTQLIRVGAPLHTDDCPMIDVVKDALARIPGPPEQVIVLLQPTQPLRQPKHLRAAIALLESSGADSVVTVTAATSPDKLYFIDGDELVACLPEWHVERRQDARDAYRADGTCYAFYRRNVIHGHIYGRRRVPLVIPPDETCELDTSSDWQNAERRLRALS